MILKAFFFLIADLELRPARVDSLSLFENTSTELRGGAAALFEFLQTFLRIFSKQKTLQRVKEAALHELLLLLRAGLGLQTEDPGNLLLQVAEQLGPDVCSLEPSLQKPRPDVQLLVPVLALGHRLYISI